MSESETIAEERQRCRIDFEQTLVRADEATRMAYFAVRPHRRRYTEVKRDGEVFYLDKFFNTLIPKSEIARSLQEMTGAPLHSLSPTVGSMPEYAAERKEAISSELVDAKYIPPKEQADAHRALPSGGERRWLVFLSVDICGSSALRKANPDAYDRALSIFLREAGTLVGQFHGAILKMTGDGLIAYIDFPAFARQSDNAVDLGLSFITVLKNSINPALSKAGLPTLNIRVGADAGYARITTFEIPATGYQSHEVASDALNQAVKIQEGAEPNQLRIGRSLYELLHVDWLERATLSTKHEGLPSDYEVYALA